MTERAKQPALIESAGEKTVEIAEISEEKPTEAATRNIQPEVVQEESSFKTARGSQLTNLPSIQDPRNQNQLVLGYWNMRGMSRGNPARYLLSYSGVVWEDRQYSFGQQEWQQAKSTLMPFANLPHLIDGDFKVTETIAVHQYIAQKFCPQVLGSTPQERGRRYQLQCIAND